MDIELTSSPDEDSGDSNGESNSPPKRRKQTPASWGNSEFGDSSSSDDDATGEVSADNAAHSAEFARQYLRRGQACSRMGEDEYAEDRVRHWEEQTLPNQTQASGITALAAMYRCHYWKLDKLVAMPMKLPSA